MLVTDRKGRGNLGVNFVSRYKLPRNFEITGTECFEHCLCIFRSLCVLRRDLGLLVICHGLLCSVWSCRGLGVRRGAFWILGKAGGMVVVKALRREK